MFRRAWRAILIASVGAWAALSPALAPSGGGSASAQDACVSPDANLDLNVAVGSESVKPGDVVTFTLDVSNLPSAINGAQALIHFDDSVLTLVEITPNGGQGWADFHESETSGDITYIVSIFSGDVQVDHTIATLTFLAIAEGTTRIEFRDVPPLVTKLTRTDSTTLLPCTSDSSSLTIACDDGLFCNGIETFVVDACQPGTPIYCSTFADECNTGVCNEMTDACEAQPVSDSTSCGSAVDDD